MLFVIDSSMSEAVNQPTPPDEVVIALQNIASAYSEGQHLVFAKPDVLDILRDCQYYSQPTRSIYNKIFNRLRGSGIRPGMFIRQLEVVAQPQIFETYQAGQCKVIRLSANYVNNSLISPTIFLGENHSDLELYERITRVYLLQTDFAKIGLHYEPMGGFGDTIHIQYKTIQNAKKKRLCLAIVDSDRDVPPELLGKIDDRKVSGLGETAKKIALADKPQELLCELLTLDVRMIENLVPIALYRDALPPNDKLQDTVKFMEQLEPETRRYIHFKNGLKLKELLPLNSEKPLVKYWLPILQKLKLPLTCQRDVECRKKEECKCYLVPFFGPKILETAMKFIKPQDNNEKPLTDQELAKFLDEPLKLEWDKIGQRIVAWCCGLVDPISGG